MPTGHFLWRSAENTAKIVVLTLKKRSSLFNFGYLVYNVYYDLRAIQAK
jgi:hypothetical protein